MIIRDAASLFLAASSSVIIKLNRYKNFFVKKFCKISIRAKLMRHVKVVLNRGSCKIFHEIRHKSLQTKPILINMDKIQTCIKAEYSSGKSVSVMRFIYSDDSTILDSPILSWIHHHKTYIARRITAERPLIRSLSSSALAERNIQTKQVSLRDCRNLR